MKILVVRFSSIGDIVLTSSVARCIKKQLKNSEVHYLTKEIFKDLVKNSKYIDKVFGLANNWETLVAQLKKENYDYVIDLHNNLRTKRLQIALNKQFLSYPKRNIEKYLLTNLKWNIIPQKEHVVDRYFNAVKKLGVENDNLPNDFFINNENEIDVSKYYLTPKKYLAIAIGAQYLTKRLPIQKIISITENISLPIVLLGNNKEALDAEKIIQKSSNKNIISVCGELNILQSASIVKQAKVLLTHDTGLMHIASCFDTYIVAIWGNTVPAFGMCAYTPTRLNQSSNIEVNELSCRPCSKIGYLKCPKNHFKCMELQDTDKISEQILIKLNS